MKAGARWAFAIFIVVNAAAVGGIEASLVRLRSQFSTLIAEVNLEGMSTA